MESKDLFREPDNMKNHEFSWYEVGKDYHSVDGKKSKSKLHLRKRKAQALKNGSQWSGLLMLADLKKKKKSAL